VEELKSHFELKKDALEPIKTFAEYKQTASYRAIIPILCRLRDANRTEGENRQSVGTETKL